MAMIALRSEETTSRYQVEPGHTHPLGAVPDEKGINFSIFADHATAIELLLFDDHDDPEPVRQLNWTRALIRPSISGMSM